MIVPPVPTPATNASGRSRRKLICHQISGPVVSKWASTLSWFENCRGRKAGPLAAAHCFGQPMLPRKPFSSRLTETDPGPQAPDEVLALLAHPVRHEDMDGVAERAPDRGE